MGTTRKRSLRFKLLLYTALLAYVVVALAPMYWMALTSLRTEKQIYSRQAMLTPSNLTLDNFEYATTKKPLLIWLSNSFLVATSTVVISTVISALAGYALARLRFLGRNNLARLLVYTYLIPSSLLFIPMFLIMNNYGLLDTRTGLVLSYLSFTVPFGTWLLLGYFGTIPHELEDAARIDGCSYFGVLRRVVIPLSKPALVVTFLFCFTDAWNEFLYAAVLITKMGLRTAPLGLTDYKVLDTYLWGPLMAAALIITVPAIVLYMLAQRFVVRGLTTGAVKG